MTLAALLREAAASALASRIATATIALVAAGMCVLCLMTAGQAEVTRA